MASKYGRGNFRIEVRPIKLEAGLIAQLEQLRCGVFNIYIRQGVYNKEFTEVRGIIVYLLPSFTNLWIGRQVLVLSILCQETAQALKRASLCLCTCDLSFPQESQIQEGEWFLRLFLKPQHHQSELEN